MYSPRTVTDELANVIGREHVITDRRELRRTTDNTMGVRREVVAKIGVGG